MIKFNDKKKESDRIKAYKLLNKLKDKGISRPEIIKILIDNYGVNKGRVYDWYSGRNMPWKLKEKVEHLEYCEELFYLLGAMLGDGCIYEWKGQFQVKIYGEKEFIEKCAIKLSLCLKKDIKCYYYKSYFKTRGSHLWYIQTSHKKLFMLFQSIRTDLGMVLNLMKNKSFKGNSINFIEGFFDAEGCVKIIKEKVRKTPKICLDITSTFFEYQELIKKLLVEHLNIEARYSIQIPKDHWIGKKTVYHLRIYKKEFIRKFLNHMSTIKLKPKKVAYVENWLNNGLGS